MSDWDILTKFVFDVITITLFNIFKFGQHLIMAFFVIMIMATLRDNEIMFGDFNGFDFGGNDGVAMDYADPFATNNTLRVFSPNNTRDAYRIPYDDYQVSNGSLHGLNGWLGVDLVSGCGAPIYSPITGVVTINGFDGYIGQYSEQMPYGVLTTSYGYTYPNESVKRQNTWIEITGDDGIHRTILIHGIYTPPLGQHVAIGEQIGTENRISNAYGVNKCHSHVILYENGKEINILTPQ